MHFVDESELVYQQIEHFIADALDVELKELFDFTF